MTEVEDMETVVLDRYTQFKANFPPIKAPRFHDGTIIIQAGVGPHNKIVCTYRRSDGSEMFPEPLYISGAEAKKYKPFAMDTVAGGKIMVRAVPIKKFKVLKINQRSMHDVW